LPKPRPGRWRKERNQRGSARDSGETGSRYGSRVLAFPVKCDVSFSRAIFIKVNAKSDKLFEQNPFFVANDKKSARK
jgi:hypothetical protein